LIACGRLHDALAHFDFAVELDPALVEKLAGPESAGNIFEVFGIDLLATEPRSLIPCQHVLEPSRIEVLPVFIR
jgi:hypothetical protein